MTTPRSIARASLGPLALLVAYVVLVHVAASTDLVSRILAPGGEGATAAIALGASMLVLRLALLFVLPGALLYRLVEAWLAARTR